MAEHILDCVSVCPSDPFEFGSHNLFISGLCKFSMDQFQTVHQAFNVIHLTKPNGKTTLSVLLHTFAKFDYIYVVLNRYLDILQVYDCYDVF